MNKRLIESGWHMYYSCNCGGTYKEFYASKQHPDYEIRLRPRSGTASVLCKNLVVVPLGPMAALPTKLKKYGIEIK